MATDVGDLDALRQRIRQLERELTEQKHKNADLERARSSASSDDLAVPISEFEETLRRLVQRTAMIVQAEKCVIMVRDSESGALVARSPAFGMSENDVNSFQVQPDTGFSGRVFQSGEPAIFHRPDEDPCADKALLGKLRVRNGVTVPLIIERRDDQNHLVDRLTIGVLHCFNKRYGGDFIDEDVRLLERLSRNAAAVIANAQMFQELVKEKQKLVHTLESLTAGLILINQHGRIGQMNAQARAMFGVQNGDNPVGRSAVEVIKHDSCREIMKRKAEEAQNPLQANGSEEGESPQRPDEITLTDEDDQEYIYQVHAAHVHDDSNTPIGTVFIFNDITDLRNVERMKTEFVSIVSHELRTPLTPMKGFVRTLLDDENEEWYTREDRREFYGIIDQNVDRLKRLIDDLLNVSRIERMGVAGIEMNWEEVDIQKAAEEVVGVQRARTDKHALVIDFEPDHIVAETDPDMIQNILQNLVSNAIKYSPDGGEVRIIGRLEGPSEAFPEGAVMLLEGPSEAFLEGAVVMGVKDHGTGIPEAALKKLGEKFFRVDNKDHRKVGGTGIGLFLVINLIAAHHGSLWVESELGKGSTFWFRIPIKQPKDAPKEETPAEPATR